MSMPAPEAVAVDRARSLITEALGSDLHSLILYGSAARGGAVAGKSDLNLLVVLAQSSHDVHRRLRGALRGCGAVDPLVFSQRDLPHTFRAFAAKFVSIRRSYRVLAGADVLAQFEVSPEQMRFLVAQGLRNVKLRLTRAYLRLSLDRAAYTRAVLRFLPALLVDVSEAVRLTGRQVPLEFGLRPPVLSEALGVDCAVLGELLSLRAGGGQLSEAGVESAHERLLNILRASLPLVEGQA
jgi:hypothetical protein